MESEGSENQAVIKAVAESASPSIAMPHRVQDLGLRKSLIQDLALKILYLQGELLLINLADQMRLSMNIVSEVFEHLRKEQLCEVKGMVGGVYRVVTTSLGNARARELLELSHYAGPAPVSLEEYTRRVQAQTVHSLTIHPADVEKAFQHLVLPRFTLTQLGIAIVSGHSILLHGPSGTGKTAVAETIAGITQGSVLIPYAIEVASQIITVFDSYVHERIEEPEDEQTDKRWIRCRRPRVIAGGELKLEMLDLQFNPAGRYYSAPLQVKANNGVLVVDDFGRQQARPEDVLNRWLAPLGHKTDYLTLEGGRRFSIPFDLFVVFVTSLEKLMDEAFLRRIQSKVRLDYCTSHEFHEIFRRVCAAADLTYEAGVVDELVSFLERSGRPLRPCDPGEIATHICRAAAYEERAPSFDSASVTQACRSFFLSA